MSEVIQENWYYLAILYFVIFGWFLYKAILSNRGKIKVRVKTPTKEWVKWCKPLDDGETIVVEKATKKKAGWSFKFTNKSIIVLKSWGRTLLAVDVFYNTPKAIEYDYSVPEIDQPKWDKDTSHKFIEAKMVEKSGVEPKEKSSTGIWIVAILVIVSIVINLLSSGRIRFG